VESGTESEGKRMKQPKKLTRDQKILISSRGLNPGEFSLISEGSSVLTLHDKATGMTVTVPKKKSARK